ncbi:MAG: bifunctional serine/threonine-protein kinase/formylglycine-generating enzyme family protein [Planctomycetota bacterium]
MTAHPTHVSLEFLALLLEDREVGRERTLAEYQALFPAHAALIAAEWERVQHRRDAVAAATLEGEVTDGPGQVAGFTLVRELGRGGQARVWLAEDRRLGRPVALKLVPRSPFTDDLAPRLKREARAASRLDHPGLCTVYDAGVTETVAWIALRFVAGETLAAAIDAQRTTTRARMPVDEVLRLGAALARALHVAHAADIVHRDVKPANVMLEPTGMPVLLDFGVALESDGGPPLTLDGGALGGALGTPAYMAPEVLAGARASARSDVWSVGATLFEALTLRRPFEAPTPAEEARAIREATLVDARRARAGVSRDVAVVLATALTRRPEDRYATAADLAEDLERALRRAPVLARPLGPGARLVRWAQRAPGLAASLAALGLALFAGASLSAALWLRTRSALQESRALFGDVEQLADSLDARRLTEAFHADGDARGLWPALDTRIDRFEDWLANAARLEARRGQYEAVLAAARGRVAAGAPRTTDAWLVDGLAELLQQLDAVVGLRPRVERGRALAATLAARTLHEPRARAAWAAAAQGVARDARFTGFTLTPQLGLMPLGPDPASGLQEFAHCASGDVPARDPATGALALTPTSAIVLVLLPPSVNVAGALGGVGVHAVDGAHPVGAPFVDPWQWRWDGPHVAVALDAFFVAKYELTQGQWFRQTEARPSAYGAGSNGIEEADLHPVEEVSWDECVRVLAALDLALPTEAQWDYAARAGTTTVWWTGDRPETLQGAANLADRRTQALGGAHAWQWEPALEDPFVVHAPVGQLRANPFGLHDVAGNVAEWCADGYEDWASVPPRPGDGRADGDEPLRAFRGGHFTSDAVRARSGARDGFASNVRTSYIGLRAARAVRRD